MKKSWKISENFLKASAAQWWVMGIRKDMTEKEKSEKGITRNLIPPTLHTSFSIHSFVLKDAYPWKKSYEQPRQHIKKQRHHFADKGPYHQSYGFSSDHVWMWELEHVEGWGPKNWCFWIVVLQKMLENPLDRKEIKPVNPKGNQSWIIHWKDWCWNSNIWPPDVKSWLIGKDTDLEKIEGRRWKVPEDEMVWWYHWFNGHELGQTLGDSEGQGSLACCSPWCHKKSDMT